jgi:hypothetical protein
VLFSSGQSALAGILLSLLGERSTNGKLRALFLGNYFETHDLFDLFAHAIMSDRVHDWGAASRLRLSRATI